MTIKGEETQRVLDAVHAAQTGVLELRHLTGARQCRPPFRPETGVHQALDDHGAGGIVGTALGPERQIGHLGGVDVVLADQTHDGCRSHRVDVLAWPDHAERVPHHVANLVPVLIGPVTPGLQINPRVAGSRKSR